MRRKIINTLLEAVKDDTDNPFPHFALAKEYQKIDDYQSARNHYQHLVKNFPEYGGTYYHFANFLFEQKEPDNAIKIIEKGLAVLKKSGETNLYNELSSLLDQFV